MGWHFSNAMIAWAATAAALLGVILIKWGWWPNRRGSEPSCRKCGYLLIGIDSQRCPECGTAFSPATVARGLRPTRRGLGWTGLLLVLVGVVGAVRFGTKDI
jgi:hypothetical protein